MHPGQQALGLFSAVYRVEMQATVSPGGAQITVPFEIELKRVEPFLNRPTLVRPNPGNVLPRQLDWVMYPNRWCSATVPSRCS